MPAPSAESADRATRAAADRRRALRAPALLVLLAAVQLVLALGYDLSAWKGGGFGMFSTNDHGAFRVLVVRVERPGAATPERVPLPPELAREGRRVREFPSPALLRALARDVAAAHPEAAAVQLRVFRTRFDPESLEPSREPLAELRLETEPSP